MFLHLQFALLKMPITCLALATNHSLYILFFTFLGTGPCWMFLHLQFALLKTPVDRATAAAAAAAAKPNVRSSRWVQAHALSSLSPVKGSITLVFFNHSNLFALQGGFNHALASFCQS
jgi:hypothetical protein